MSKPFTVAFNQGRIVKTFKSNEELNNYVFQTYGKCRIFNLTTREGNIAFKQYCENEKRLSS